MPTLQRLNMDTSWHLSWSGTGLVFDPWLVGSEVDGFKWFNEQWHTTEPVAPHAVPAFDAIVISQSYADHCHYPTLTAMVADRPVLGVERAQPGLRKHLAERELRLVPERPEAVEVGALQVSCLRPDRRLDPIYYAIVVQREREAIVYCPHGFVPTAEHRAQLEGLEVRALLTTFTDFRLPAVLGGHVSPGLDNVHALVAALRPRAVLNCHDEDKRAQGLVSRLAKVERADLDRIRLDGARFIPTPDYGAVEV